MKRGFRSKKQARQETGYPTLREGRRTFLRELGGLVAGGALASMLGACGERAVGDDPPETTGGLPDRTPAPLDAGPETTGGMADVYQAPLDMYPPPTSEGAALPPDGFDSPDDMGLPPSSETLGGMADAFLAPLDLKTSDSE